MSPRARGRGRAGGDAGQVAGLEAVAAGLLVAVVGALLAAGAWAVVDGAGVAGQAATAAARAYVEAPDPATGLDRAQRAARAVVAGHGRDPSRLTLVVEHDGAAPWGRCVRATARATYAVPAVHLPWVGQRGRAHQVGATHSELVDPHRAGLPGAC